MTVLMVIVAIISINTGKMNLTPAQVLSVGGTILRFLAARIFKEHIRLWYKHLYVMLMERYARYGS
jgi:membrane-associated protease RseP (regulator of RpoE activity)